MKIDEQINWFARRTPGHLQGYVTNECPELGLGPGGHGEEIAVGYRLKCRCGNLKFAVSAFLWKRDAASPETLLSPISAECSDCNSTITVFDSDLHGYDPVACESSTTAHGEREDHASEYVIASKSSPATVDLIAYYPDDLFEEDFSEFAERRNDLFTWVRIIVGENIDPDYPLLDFECA